MPRSALPQNYVLNNGTVMVAIDDTTGWSAPVDGGSIALDSTNFLTGTGSLRVTTGVGKKATTQKTISLKVTNHQNIGLWFYLHTPVSYLKYIVVYLSSVADLSICKHMTIHSTKYKLQLGWNYINTKLADWGTTGAESWDNTMIRVRLRTDANTGLAPSISYDCIRNDIKQKPMVLITFDDGGASGYTEAFAYMNARGLKGTCYINSDTIDGDGMLTLTQIKAMYAAGWAIANHTDAHVDLTASTEAQITSALSDCTNYLIANDMPRAAYHVSYPWGQRDATVDRVMGNLSMKTGRNVTVSGRVPAPAVSNYDLPCFNVEYDTTLATVKGLIDTAITNQEGICLLFHNIEATAIEAGKWTIANFQALMNYIIERHIDCVTIDEWYEGLTNPRYRSLPLSRATA